MGPQGPQGPQGPAGQAGSSVVTFLSSGAATSWTNMPSATTEFRGNSSARVMADLTGLTEFRLMTNQAIAGAGSARLRMEYSLDGTTWSVLEGGGANTGDLIASAAGVRAGAYASIAPAARTSVQLRVVGYNGNGSSDPAWSQLALQGR